mgnify:CR=1 FL=1
MAEDKELKRKRKRKEKQAQRRAAKDRAVKVYRTEELSSLFTQYLNAGQFDAAWLVAQKLRKSSPTAPLVYEMLYLCGVYSGNRERLYEALRFGFEHGHIKANSSLVHLLALADYYNNVHLMEQVLETLETKKSSFVGKLEKKEREKLAEVKQRLSARQAHREKQAAQPPPPPPSVPSKEAESPHMAETQDVGAEEGNGREPAFRKPEDSLKVSVHAEIDPHPLLDVLQAGMAASKERLDVALEALQVSFQSTYDELLCLSTLTDVDSYWYQQETARKVMKHFRGRAILADEVGLGKTIEACLVLKEYMVRGLVKKALILVPSALVNQWQAELRDKFGLHFVSTNDDLFKQDPAGFWKQPLVVASLQTARTARHFDAVTSRFDDLVIVDEAHHLKNHTTANWKLVNNLHKTFLLLLTATPVQNNLEELYNLVTLLKPGHLQTRKAFKEQFVARGNPFDPINRDKLRALLQEVMVRNTRSVAQVQLPPRFATTVQVEPSSAEKAFDEAVHAFVRHEAAQSASGLLKQQLRKVLEAAGSSPYAAAGLLENLARHGNGLGRQAASLAKEARSLHEMAKARRVVELVRAIAEPVILFVNYRATLEALRQMFAKRGVDHVVFTGGMTNEQKKEAVEAFRKGRRVFLSTGTGGEGHNLQFCHTLINYDLPWNPMEIEQRIGRLHRIGQRHPVQVYNFCAAGSIEERILDVLDRKINMFELVVGEIDMILGRLQGEKEFAEMVFDLWVTHGDEASREKAFEALATRLKKARTAYEKTKALDEKLFQDDFGT